MPKMHIDRSVVIDAPLEKVKSTVNDFHHWQPWSPWLISDPEAQVDVRADGKYYEWQGPRSGSGNMTVLKEAEHRTDYDLTFLKPWKSKAKVAFKFVAQGDQSTKVSWTMDSSLPFFMFFMAKSMTAFVSSDYDRGLNMLKDYIEAGSVPSKLVFKGESRFEGVKFVGIKRATSISDMDVKMSADFETIGKYAEEQGDNVAAPPMSIYHKWDMVKQAAEYSAVLPVQDVPSDLPSEMYSGSIPEGKIHTVQHIGAYRHLGNAWTTMYMLQRAKEFKPLKHVHPFETYENAPGEVPDEELITNVNFMVK